MLMSTEISKIDKALLDYLEDKYRLKKDTPLYNSVKMVLQRLWQGSVCVSIEDLNINVDCLKNEAIGKDGEIRPLIFDGENLYIQRYFIYQKRILEKIEILLADKKIHIITGSPGTGKTTSLSKILKIKLNEGISIKRILLAAPTGKAALRMKESLAANDIKLEAKTLHRLLGYKHLSINFKHAKKNPLEAAIVAIDECSMVDLPMMAKLLDAIPNDCDLYLLGDKHQLASVEAGSIFADICRMFEKKFKNDENIYKELSINYRAKEAPGIQDLSKQILESSKKKSVENFENENVRYFERFQLENEPFYRYKNLFSAANKEEALEFLKTFQILCATKVGKNGTENVNRKLCDIARKEKAKWLPIIITENDYSQNLFNGDVGIKTQGEAYFYTGKNEIKTFSTLILPKYEPAFAITIHKSQGSEYETVAVVYPEREIENEERTLLTKELLYTAITRAKKECFIFGAKEVLTKSCEREIYRASGIK
jgi:exodeoxyribonuclease V alpha subunit